nr:MAG TPA: hypothetical protein [Caudoviricetes sp.]
MCRLSLVREAPLIGLDTHQCAAPTTTTPCRGTQFQSCVCPKGGFKTPAPKTNNPQSYRVRASSF